MPRNDALAFPYPLYNLPHKPQKFQRPTKRVCACGCGEPVSGVLHSGRTEKFKRGHQNKKRLL